MAKTKIVATLGPATTPETLHQLINNGVDALRLNMSHCTRGFADLMIEYARQNLPSIPIVIDVNGPKIRTGKLKDHKPIWLEAGEEFHFVNDINVLGDETMVATTYTDNVVKMGDMVFVDDGLLAFRVKAISEDGTRVITEIENSGYLGENKGVNLPGYVIKDIAVLSQRDRDDIKYAMSRKVDFVSVGCIRGPEDVEEIRLLLGNSRTKLLSKIENHMAMQHFDEILRRSEGVVIDRGYLGVEIDIAQVATVQHSLIAKAHASGKIALVANQMLESMTRVPRPTRGEAVDIANAVRDGADALILSSETAVGSYPVKSADMMRQICAQTEASMDYLELQNRLMKLIPRPVAVSESIASSAVVCSRLIGAKAILVLTEVGGTARLVAKYRPTIPIIASTRDETTARQLQLIFGVISYLHDGEEDLIRAAFDFGKREGILKPKDVVVITSGQVQGFNEGSTTRMQLVVVP